MKKFYAFLALVALLTSFLLSLGVASAATFPDVATNHGNFIAVEYLVNIGTLKGYGDGMFKPSNTVNRAELMKVLVAGQGIDPDNSKYQNCFPDVTTDWYAEFVCYGKEKGWVAGYPDGTFQPAKTVNRVEAIKMSVNALGFGDLVASSVTEKLYDDTDNSQWYAPYLEVAKNLTLVEESSGKFFPTDGMKRATISENIFRSLVSLEYERVPYIEEFRDEFLVNEDMEDLLVEAGEMDDDEGDDIQIDEDVSFMTDLVATDETVETDAMGTGSFVLSNDDLEYMITVEDLFKDITGSHFHNAGTGQVETAIAFEGDVDSGVWTSSGTWSGLTGDQQDALLSGMIYVNVHTADYPSGEITGYLQTLDFGDEAGQEEGEEDDQDDKVAEQEEHDVDMEVGNFFFNPDTIVASPGQTVNLTFTAVEGTHTFAIDEIGLEESVSDLGVVTFTAPDEPGEYAFYCSVGSHRSMGMEGTLIVQ